MSDLLDKDLTTSSIGEAFKQCIAHMKVRTVVACWASLIAMACRYNGWGSLICMWTYLLHVHVVFETFTIVCAYGMHLHPLARYLQGLGLGKGEN